MTSVDFGSLLRMILVVFSVGAEVDRVLEMALVELVVGLKWWSATDDIG